LQILRISIQILILDAFREKKMLKILSQEEEQDHEFILSRSKTRKFIFHLGSLISMKMDGMNSPRMNLQIINFAKILLRNLKNLAKAMNSLQNFDIVLDMTSKTLISHQFL